MKMKRKHCHLLSWILIFILSGVISLFPETVTAAAAGQVRVRVEGTTTTTDTLVAINDSTQTALDALKNAPHTVAEQAPGWVTGINGETNSGTDWMYYVIRGGSIDATSMGVGSHQYNLQNGDEIVFYKGKSAPDWSPLTYLPVISDPIFSAADQTLYLEVKPSKYDWGSNQLVFLNDQQREALGEYTFKVNGASYTSNNGSVSIPFTGITTDALPITVTNPNQGYNDLVPFRGQVTGTSVARAALLNTINQAASYLDQAVAGTLPGQYLPEVKTSLNGALATAQTEFDRVDATKSTLNSARTALETAVYTFLAAVNPPLHQPSERLSKVLNYYKGHAVLADWWDMIALRGIGEDLNSGQWTLPDLKVEQLDPIASGVSNYSKAILGLMARGINPASVNGKNLVQELADKQQPNGCFGQYLNEHIWATIALDAAGGQNEATAQATAYLVTQQQADGGFSYFSNTGDVDLTGWVLIALGLHQTEAGVADTITRAKQFMTGKQLPSGGFTDSWEDKDNANTAACVISGLVAVGENPDGAAWSKNGVSALTALTRYQTGNGGYSYRFPLINDQFATSQALIALGDTVAGSSVFSRLRSLAPTSLATLTRALLQAQHKYEIAVVGSQPGQYPSSAVETLEQAIDAARSVVGNTQATAEQINTAAAALTDKVSQFERAVIVSSPTEIPGSITCSVTGYQGTRLAAPEQVQLRSGDTPLSVLMRLVGESQVKYDAPPNAYVREIMGLREFDHGPTSGWKYRVNGTVHGVGANSIQLKNGDDVEWFYVETADSNSAETPVVVSSLPTVNDLQSALKGITIPADMTLDNLKASIKVTVVENSSNTMKAEQARQLKNDLAQQQVSFSFQAKPGSDFQGFAKHYEAALQIPAGAINRELELTVKELSNTKISAPAASSSIYEFGPTGSSFSRQVQVTIRVPMDSINPDKLVMAWYNTALQKWVPVPTVVDASTGLVSASVDHFTAFAVMNLEKAGSSSLAAAATMAGQVASYMKAQQIVSDWAALGLILSGKPGAEDYSKSLAAAVKSANGKVYKITDLERQVLTAAALGLNPGNIEGHDLLELIYNSDRLTMQGTNGVAYGLIALDSCQATVPASARWNQNHMIKWILAEQQTAGAWALTKNIPGDVDVTAMTLTALAPYQQQPEVKKAVDKALIWLAGVQLTNGGFTSGGAENSESSSQVIMALCSLGLSPDDSRFTKTGGSLLSQWAKYQQANGGFAHLTGQPADATASEQALLALVAWQRYQEGKSPIFQLGIANRSIFTDAAWISSWARSSVDRAWQLGIVKGEQTKAPRFAPANLVSRAELVAMLGRMQLSNGDNKAEKRFRDVAAGAWYYNSVYLAAAKGWVTGTPQGDFEPLRPITRQEMAIILLRVRPQLTKQATGSVTDIEQADAYAREAIARVVSSGLMVGNGGKFDPGGKVTREMAVTILMRLNDSK